MVRLDKFFELNPSDEFHRQVVIGDGRLLDKQ